MGVGGEKPEMREIAGTKAAARDEAFEAVIQRVKDAGGQITQDETTPLYIEVGNQEFEIGTQRVVEFSLNQLDIQLTRKVETAILQGAGHQKHVEELETPHIKIIMKRKPQMSSDWQIVDLDEMF